MNDDLTGLNKDLVAVSDIQEKGIDKNQEILDEIDQFPTGRQYITYYLHFHCESLNEPLHLRCGSYLHEQIDLSHFYIGAI